MAIEVRMQDWLNANAVRSYPFCDDATQTDTTGAFSLPKSLIVELRLSVHAGLEVDPSRFHLKSLGVFGAGVSLVVGYDNGATSVPVASAMIPRDSVTARNLPFRLSGLGDFYDAVGHVVIGRLDDLDQQPAGQWEFSLAGARLEQDAIVPNIRGVTSISVRNGLETSGPFYGDIVFQAGKNMRITANVAGGLATLVFDAVRGEGLNEEPQCPHAAAGTAIKTINGIPPSPDGNFTLLSQSECLDLQPITAGLKLADKCSEPCCGCKELEIVTQAMMQFGDQATTLENFLVSLEARVTQMDQVVLGSRLGDRGCGNEE